MATLTRDQMIQAGNDALFELRASRPLWNARAEFFAHKPVYKQRAPEPIIERQRYTPSNVYDYYYGSK